MGAILNEFRAAGITFDPLPDGRLKAFGPLKDEVRAKIREHKASILAELSVANDPASTGAYRRWSIHFPSLTPADAIFHPEATRDEALQAFHGAIDATPLPEPPSRPATPAEAVELRELVALILRDADAAEQAQALAVALADPDAALTSFRVLAADQHPDPAPYPDDRRSCEQCVNLAPRGRDGWRRCLAAARGELPYVANKRYAPVPDVPKRCEGYQPKASEADQRIGTERWPQLSGGAK